MARQDTLPPTLRPRLVKRDVAAAYLSVSPTTYDVMVKDGRMPRPKLLGDRRKAWDLNEIDLMIERLPIELGESEVDETWDDINAT